MKTHSDTGLHQQLKRAQSKRRALGGNLVSEANRILNKDLFTEGKILQHLGQYNALSGFLEEDQLDGNRVFSLAEIRQICITWRLKFLNSKLYKPVIPYEAVLMIKDLNLEFAKELDEFLILAPARAFAGKTPANETLLFTKTSDGNYYLIHRWGRPLKPQRQWLYWPMRHFENLLVTVFCFTLGITLALPTWLITLDHAAEYWSGYRAAAFFHLFIFNLGVTTYFTFAFAKNFSSTVWNREQDFG